jgi:hypothetical protein
MGKTTKTETAARAGDLVAGTKKHYPNPGDKLAFDGASYTVQEVTDHLQSVVTLREATEAAQATAKAKVAAEKAQLPALLAFMAAYVAFVRATFGNSPDALADFGVEPKKAPTPPTIEQRAAAVAKREATRAARGTKGPKARLGVKGAVTGVVVTPIVATSSPASPATPATAPKDAASAGSSSGSAPHGS